MNALLMEVPAGVSLPTVRREVGEDFFYVLEGTVELTIGDKQFELASGDSVHINTQIDHSVVNNGDGTARLIWVGCQRRFKTDPFLSDVVGVKLTPSHSG